MNENTNETACRDGKSTKPDISAWLTSPKMRNFIVWAGLIGMGLILLSYFFDSSKKAETSVSSQPSSDYAAVMETKLHDLLLCVEGVTNCQVLVTLEDSGRLVYASNNSKEPLTECEPTVRGVVVVVEGVVSDKTEAEIKTVVKTALHLAEKRVCVVANTVET